MTPNRRSTDPQESIVANGTGAPFDEVASPAPGEGQNAPEAITAPQLTEPVGVRFVEGGAVSAQAYPDAGEPDWKARAESLRRQLRANENHVSDAMMWARKIDLEVLPEPTYAIRELVRLFHAERESSFATISGAIRLLQAVDRDSNARQLACFDEVAAFLDSVGAR